MRVALRIAIEHAIRLLSLLQAGVYVSCGQDRAIACGCYSYAVAASMHVCQLSDTRPSLHLCQQDVPRPLLHSAQLYFLLFRLLLELQIARLSGLLPAH